jgi:acyl transferase domain-containing protein
LINGYSGTGTSASAVSGRVSFYYNFLGPSLSVGAFGDLNSVALQLGCQTLLRGESELAMVGAVSVRLVSEPIISECKSQIASNKFSSESPTFAASEGAVAFLLRPLRDAERSFDRILGVIRGVGIGAPSIVPDISVMHRALSAAGLTASNVDYVESHGTGTPLGDPIEMKAIDSVYGSDRVRPLYVGACKPYIGHGEVVSGAAGLLKVLLSFQHDTICGHPHLRHLNSDFSSLKGKIEIPRESVEWKRGDHPRVAAVSSFGFAGANAHVLVSEPPKRVARPSTVERGFHLLKLSAKSPKALAAMVARYIEALSELSGSELDFCFTANAGRSDFTYRIVVIGRSRVELIEALRSEASSARHEGKAPTSLGRFDMSAQETLTVEKAEELARRYVEGYDIDWNSIERPFGGCRIEIPSYPFDEEKFWPLLG